VEAAADDLEVEVLVVPMPRSTAGHPVARS
jgi:hypothetical protein